MAVSFSRPDPSSPAAVASASFSTSRRGFDADEVRDFLRMVSAELSRLQERERFLERELHDAQGRMGSTAELDEATVTRLLGEETARVLSTAREAAAQTRTRAEDGAARLLREAQDDAARLREEIDVEIARRRQDAIDDAEAEVAAAKQQGRDMVDEARAYRERVLADLAKRREHARANLQELATGRERLVQAFERARLVTADVLAEIGALADEGEPEPGDTPPGGVASVRPAAGGTTRSVSVESFDDLDDVPELYVIQPEDAVEQVVVVVEDPDVSGGSEVTDGGGTPELDDTVVDLVVEVVPDEDDPVAPVVSLFAGELDVEATVEPVVEADDAEAPGEPTAVKPSVDDLFAKLKAAKADEIARDALAAAAAREAADAASSSSLPDVEPAEGGTDPSGPIVLADLDVSPFVRRDEELAPFEVTLARRFKRVLADEQSDLLDVLRGREPVRSVDALLPGDADHVQAYVSVALDDLTGAAHAGAASLSDEPADRLARRVGDADVVGRIASSIGDELVLPLRERVSQAVDEAAGDHRVLGNHLRAIYREWKTQWLDDRGAALLRCAYAAGAAAAIVPGAAVCWVADPTAAPCPDGEVNGAAGAVRFGDAFPSGDRQPPGHSGCACLLVEAGR